MEKLLNEIVVRIENLKQNSYYDTSTNRKYVSFEQLNSLKLFIEGALTAIKEIEENGKK